MSRTASPLYTVSFNGHEGRHLEVVTGTPGVWRWKFICGKRPIKAGGGLMLFCEVPKFWLATCVQAKNSSAPGYVKAYSEDATAIELVSFQENWKALAWATLRLPAGMKQEQSVVIQFGTDSAPCHIVTHKYDSARVSWRIDYEAEDMFCQIWPPMTIRALPGKAAKLNIVVPSFVLAGREFTLRGRVEDHNSNIGAALEEQIILELVDEENHAVPQSPRSEQVDLNGTFLSKNWRIQAPGVYRVRATTPDLPPTLSNPCICANEDKELLGWGDCHCHSEWADGSGTLENNVNYARNQAFLDVFAFAEHIAHTSPHTTCIVDKSGADGAIFGNELADCVNRAYDPGRFVTLLAYEYTPTIKKTQNATGDCCVFSPSSRWEDLPMAFEYPDLVALAKANNCIVIPHVGGRTPDLSKIIFDAGVTPLIEIASMHGHFECFAQQALQHGIKVGFVGMSDTHFGMPGYDNWAQHGRTPGLRHRNYSVQSPLTAFFLKAFTRKAVFDAIRNRRTYATTGARILIDFSIQNAQMGSEMTIDTAPRLRIRVHGTAPLALIDIIRNDRRLYRLDATGRMDLNFDWVDSSPLQNTAWYYIRVTQTDFALGWSSPIWVTYTGAMSTPAQSLPAWNDPPHWPPDSPETCDEAFTRRLAAIFNKRGISGRFTAIHQVGLFTEPRGRFALFRGRDSQRNNMPVHIHLYVDFDDDRLYIADGESDYGMALV